MPFLTPSSYKTTGKLKPHHRRSARRRQERWGSGGRKLRRYDAIVITRLRQAAIKFFANLSAEKRGDLQKYFIASSHRRHTHTAENIPLPVAPGACRGAAIATLQNAHEQKNNKRPRAKQQQKPTDKTTTNAHWQNIYRASLERRVLNNSTPCRRKLVLNSMAPLGQCS